MPVYEYECLQCNKTIEIQQKISDTPLSSCPECGQEVKKLISRSSFHLKGNGWYADGYSNDKENKKDKTVDASVKKEKKTAKDSSQTAPCKGGETSCKGCPAAASTD
jgi:putative FmdB family regulatory protein